MDLRDAKLGECQYRPIVQHRDRYSVKFCIAQYSVVAYMGNESKEEWIYAYEMATHSSLLAWKIPWTEACSGLQSMQSQTVRQD